MRKPDFNGLNFKVWGYVMAFSLAIILLLWTMQIAFLNVYYQNMKRGSVTSAASRIAVLYGRVQGQELERQLQKLANDSDLFLNIVDGDGKSLLSVDPVGRDYRTPVESFGIWQNGGGRVVVGGGQQKNAVYGALAQRILGEPSGQMTLGIQDQQGLRMLIYGRRLTDASGNTALLIVNSPLQPLTETVKILSRQLVYLSIAIFAMAVIVSIAIARRVSRPIARIRDRAKLLAEGHLEPSFERGEYSEVGELADTLNHTALALQQVETLRTELIANVSHDLRTPLTMIRVYAEMIRDLYAENPDKRGNSVAVIIEECDRLTGLVQNLLDLSKLQSGVDELERAPFDLRATIERTLRRYEPLEQEGYRIAIGSGESAMVVGDEARIEQVLYNLINNAVNYTGENKAVNIAIVDRGDRVRVLIEDSGPGIAPEDAEHIWDRYYKVDKEQRRAVAGSGLGLAIVRSILDMHGTACGVDSVPGHGSTFWFELERDEGE